MIEGVLPNVKQTKAEDDPKAESELEEETRLFYVGITRAIRYLQLISYTKRFEFTTSTSRFMRDLHKIVVPPPTPKETVTKIAKHHRNEQTILSAHDLKVGNEVRHIIFGVGEIVSIERGVIEILFPSGKKKFVVDTCLEQGYLEHL